MATVIGGLIGIDFTAILLSSFSSLNGTQPKPAMHARE